MCTGHACYKIADTLGGEVWDMKATVKEVAFCFCCYCLDKNIKKN